MNWFRIKAAAGNDPPEILIYDEIVTGGAEDFRRALKALDGFKQIDLRINSYGGDCFDGLAIYNALAQHPATIAGYIDGLAASAASVPLMAADTIRAPANAFVGVHNPMTITLGNAADHAAAAADLARISDAYAEIYAARSEQSLAAVKALMDEDRLMRAEEARAFGLVDEILPAEQMAATFDLGKLPRKHRDLAVAAYITDPRADPAIFVAKKQIQQRIRRERGAPC
jgi:ATP-dependent Clp endopeptidase proteolytic subunit ClpP